MENVHSAIFEKLFSRQMFELKLLIEPSMFLTERVQFGASNSSRYNLTSRCGKAELNLQ